jgi:hypothetical protein
MTKRQKKQDRQKNDQKTKIKRGQTIQWPKDKNKKRKNKKKTKRKKYNKQKTKIWRGQTIQ